MKRVKIKILPADYLWTDMPILWLYITMYKFAVEKNEQIIKKGMASFRDGDETLTGALYLTDKRLVFVGYLHGLTFKSEKAIDLQQIAEVKGCKTLFIIPNGITITTHSGEHIVLSLNGRNEWLEAIRHRTVPSQ